MKLYILSLVGMFFLSTATVNGQSYLCETDVNTDNSATYSEDVVEGCGKWNSETIYDCFFSEGDDTCYWESLETCPSGQKCVCKNRNGPAECA
ncbi:unnamed protein product [Rhizopus stolonifer]